MKPIAEERRHILRETRPIESTKNPLHKFLKACNAKDKPTKQLTRFRLPCSQEDHTDVATLPKNMSCYLLRARSSLQPVKKKSKPQLVSSFLQNAATNANYSALLDLKAPLKNTRGTRVSSHKASKCDMPKNSIISTPKRIERLRTRNSPSRMTVDSKSNVKGRDKPSDSLINQRYATNLSFALIKPNKSITAPNLQTTIDTRERPRNIYTRPGTRPMKHGESSILQLVRLKDRLNRMRRMYKR